MSETRHIDVDSEACPRCREMRRHGGYWNEEIEQDHDSATASALPVEAARGAEPRYTEADIRAAWERGFIVGNTREDGEPHHPETAQRITAWAKAGAKGYVALLRRAPSPATTTGDQTPAEEQRGC